ncbi:TetR/AcrR family transcriptional regulator [Schumannella sp. 10F1B-5-1]|uniref:TetR/AcrR family transcriptional regulator n=1 Tax=Schumannella sp. 10F1B-5-1 TaxID=2590780 RepID=UPI002104D58E|nr:TetR/AcrR family transcriptional regulator [Schumannella sp. 10F1B-5-1]
MRENRAPRRDAAANREALLDAARVLLNREPGASLEAIAAEAGLTRRTVYGHFPNRDALLDALAQRGSERVVAAIASVDEADPVRRLALIAVRAWDEIAGVRVMAVTTVRGPRAEIVDAALTPLRRRIAEALDEGAAAGRLRDDIPAPLLARLVEDAALAVFAASVRDGLSDAESRRLVVSLSLTTAGLGWRDAAELIAADPDLVAAPARVDPLWPPTVAIDVVADAAAADASGTAPEGAAR